MTVEFNESVDAGQWDSQAEALGAGFHLCHANTMYDAIRSGGAPAFITVRDGSGRCAAVLAGTVTAPRLWPLSNCCRRAEFPTLPAAGEAGAEAVLAATAEIEKSLRARGFCEVIFAAYESPHSRHVLGELGYELTDRHEFYVDLTLGRDAMWKGFNRNRRRNIRDAEAAGLVTRVENTPEGLDMAFGMYVESMDRRGISRQRALEWSAIARRTLLPAGRVQALVTYESATPLNAALFANFGPKAYYFSSGSTDRGLQLHGPTHLLWQAMEHLQGLGVRELSLGGARDSEKGLYAFKHGFASSVVSQPGGRKTIPGLGARLSSLGRMIGHGGGDADAPLCGGNDRMNRVLSMPGKAYRLLRERGIGGVLTRLRGWLWNTTKTVVFRKSVDPADGEPTFDDVRFRLARPDDCEWIVERMPHLGDKAERLTAEQFAEGDLTILGVPADDPDKLAFTVWATPNDPGLGFLGGAAAQGDLCFRRAWVPPESRRRGYAHKGMTYGAYAAAAGGVKTIWSLVHVDNVASIRMHEKLSYELFGRLDLVTRFGRRWARLRREGRRGQVMTRIPWDFKL